MFTKETQELAKPCYEVIEKISKGKWEWEPEIGEYYIEDKEPQLIGDEIYLEHVQYLLVISQSLTPLLHWERIIKILERIGYGVTVTYEGGEELNERAYCNIWKDGKYVVEDKRGEDCQSVVMRAVIELGKELNHVKS